MHTNTLRAKTAALQKLRRAKIFLKTANKDLVTNDPQITTRRWHLYEKSQLADTMKAVLSESKPNPLKCTPTVPVVEKIPGAFLGESGLV